MSKVPDVVKRMLVGRALRSTQLGETLLPKKLALPVFATDAMSSVGYATQEILLVLALAGSLYFNQWTPVAAVAVGVVMLTVVASYRQNVRAYPSGGGDYEIASTNLGRRAGVTVAAALLCDYVLTVAVSVSSGVDTMLSTPALNQLRAYKPEIVIALIALMTVINLRGVRESGKALALPVYAFVVGIFGMAAWAVYRVFLAGDTLEAETAHDTIVPAQTSFAGFALVFLVLRAFASGCTALTGIEAISNGVPAFKKPKSRNAATTLLMMGVIALGMFGTTTVLALYTNVKVTDPSTGSVLMSGGQKVTEQDTVIAQIAHAVFSNFPFGEYYVTTLTLAILVLAANTAFNGFPVLGSILARDGFLPRQLHTRGDRLAFSNGIILLALFAVLLVIGFDADSTRLIQLYIVGVFVSFTVSQLGMIRHWNRNLRTETEPAKRRHMIRSRAINAFGFCMTGLVLVVVIVTKFSHGAWITLVAMAVLYALMGAIRRHYDRVREELRPSDDEDMVLPSRNHAIVLVSKIHKPALRALAYAKATHPSTLEAITVAVDPDESAELERQWDEYDIQVPLKTLDSPYREVTRPVLEYVRGVRRHSPRDVVTVFIPEYVVGHWWEHILHNQSALRLKARLLFTPGVMVTSVAWQLESAERLRGRPDRPAPGSIRRPPAPKRPTGAGTQSSG